jgi:hypothetical protein
MASYTLRFSDPNTSSVILVEGTSVGPGKNNYDTTLELVGPGYTNYGQATAQNFLKLLENFASPYPPLNPIKGQLWYDTSDPGRYILRVNNGTVTSSRWPSANGIYQQPNDPFVEYPNNIKEGDIWVDTSVNQLKIRYATDWTLVGPGTQAGANKSGSEAVTVQSNTGTDYPIILNWVNGKVVEIISYNDFTPRTTIEGFSVVKAGTNLTNRNSAKYNGVAERAAALELPNGTVVPSSNILRNRAVTQTHTGTFIIESNDGLQTKPTNSDENINIYAKSIGGTIKGYVDFSNTSNNATFKIGIKDKSYMLFSSNSNVGVNTLTPSATMHVNGTGKFVNTLTIDSVANLALSVGGGASFGGPIVTAGGQVNGLLTVTNTVTLGTSGSGVILNPGIDDQYDIGTTATRFRHIFAKGVGSLGTTRFFGTLTGAASYLHTPRNFSVSGQINSLPASFNGSSDVVIPTALVASAISAQLPTETPVETHTLLVLNTGTGAPAVLERISKKSFLSDVYPYRLLPGMITFYGSSTAPSGFLLCNGSAYPQASYPNLFAIIGTSYGASIPGTFRVPNLSINDAGGNPVYHIIKT